VITVPVVVSFVANVVRRIVDPAVVVDVEDHPEAGAVRAAHRGL
jgi:hypothetical protein